MVWNIYEKKWDFIRIKPRCYFLGFHESK